MQREEMLVTTEDQARALQDVGFLGQFLEAASPSDVARRLGIRANLAHHHAKRHAELGLLREVERREGKVFYRLVAQSFTHSPSLLPVGQPEEGTAALLLRLTKRFLVARERSERTAGAQAEDGLVHYAFHPDARPSPPDVAPVEARPPHLQTRTVHLDASHYRAFVRRVGALLAELEADEDADTSACTFGFVAVEGVLDEGAEESGHISTVLPPRQT